MTAPKLKTDANGNAEIAVKKVAPYPIEAQIIKVEGQPGLKAHIMKLTDFGFLMKVDGSQFYTVGEKYKVHFELPGVGAVVHTEVKVIKTYDSMEIAGKNPVKLKTIEMHFLDLSASDRSNINSYLVKSGQRKI